MVRRRGFSRLGTADFSAITAVRRIQRSFPPQISAISTARRILSGQPENVVKSVGINTISHCRVQIFFNVVFAFWTLMAAILYNNSLAAIFLLMLTALWRKGLGGRGVDLVWLRFWFCCWRDQPARIFTFFLIRLLSFAFCHGVTEYSTNFDKVQYITSQACFLVSYHREEWLGQRTRAAALDKIIWWRQISGCVVPTAVLLLTTALICSSGKVYKRQL